MSVARPEPVAGSAPRLRLLPAPSAEQPYDDDPAVRRPVLRLVRAPLPATPPASTVAERVPVLGNDASGGRTPSAALPAARLFARALVQTLVEVRSGARPLPQLQRHTTPELYRQLEEALPLRPRGQRVPPSRRDVRSVHVQQRPDGVAEVCATVRRGERVTALALRLEGVQGRWICTCITGL